MVNRLHITKLTSLAVALSLKSAAAAEYGKKSGSGLCTHTANTHASSTLPDIFSAPFTRLAGTAGMGIKHLRN
jgi:hypothetical protein